MHKRESAGGVPISENGKLEPIYDDEEFIEALEKEDGIAGTARVSEIVGCHRNTARYRLSELDEVVEKQIGRGSVWLRGEMDG